MRQRAGLHAAIAITLADELDISRGDLIAHDDRAPDLQRTLYATVCWLGDAPLDAGRKYLLRHTTREVRARIDHIGYRWNVSDQQHAPAPTGLAMNDIARVGLTLAQPIFADRYADNRATGSFILVDEATNNTVAAGMTA